MSAWLFRKPPHPRISWATESTTRLARQAKKKTRYRLVKSIPLVAVVGRLLVIEFRQGAIAPLVRSRARAIHLVIRIIQRTSSGFVHVAYNFCIFVSSFSTTNTYLVLNAKIFGFQATRVNVYRISSRQITCPETWFCFTMPMEISYKKIKKQTMRRYALSKRIKR